MIATPTQSGRADWSGFTRDKLRGREFGWPFDREAHEDRIAWLTKFKSVVEKSRSMLDLGPDWDDSGAQPILSTTWKTATDFLLRSVVKIGAGVILPTPNISPCNDGSVDLFWQELGFRLLVNVARDPDLESDYYGETGSGFVVKGTFKPNTHDLSAIIRLLIANQNG